MTQFSEAIILCICMCTATSRSLEHDQVRIIEGSDEERRRALCPRCVSPGCSFITEEPDRLPQSVDVLVYTRSHYHYRERYVTSTKRQQNVRQQQLQQQQQRQ